ncbi:hypothetical protein GRI38_01135 [Altererythrobacter aurantiacus]|uniref:Prolyl 3,4-dihydroxylase TPA1/OFD1 N-terminal domain-containing protein n=1 Tax=Parapontixanthobacter aurantiacus TaxID=1463599 RepID=A0A844ZC97_9SPHN|nr:hypothetical protein [Parapontixanthobacter aurantiacus]
MPSGVTNAVKQLFAINPELDRKALAERFALDGRIQIRNVLTHETAHEIRAILANHTPWGMAAQAEGSNFSGPQQVGNQDLATPGGRQKAQQLVEATQRAGSEGRYSFRYSQFSLVEAVQKNWNPGGPHELLLEHLNAPDFLNLVREVTGLQELVKADGQATHFGPQHYLGLHIDSHVAEGWKVAYVMSFAPDEWHPDWGGYLNFYDEEGDIVAGYKPRFNALNMFLVPRPHSVAYVAPFAPVGRFAITGWLRDR